MSSIWAEQFKDGVKMIDGIKSTPRDVQWIKDKNLATDKVLPGAATFVQSVNGVQDVHKQVKAKHAAMVKAVDEYNKEVLKVRTFVLDLARLANKFTDAIKTYQSHRGNMNEGTLGQGHDKMSAGLKHILDKLRKVADWAKQEVVKVNEV